MNNNNNYRPNEQKQKIVVNINSKPNKNFYMNTQNQSLNISNTQRQITTPSYKNNINVKVNIPTIKTENENLVEQPININSGRNNEIKTETEIEKPKYINKLPLTNISNRTYTRNNNNISHEIPKKIEQNVSYNIDSGRKQNLNKIEVNKVENKTNISNIKPSINVRNIKTQKNIVVSNVNQNKSPSTTYVNNRYDNKYKNSNRNNIAPTSQRPIINLNYKRPQTQLSTSSIKEPEVRPKEDKIQMSAIINRDKNEIITLRSSFDENKLSFLFFFSSLLFNIIFLLLNLGIMLNFI